MLEIIITGIVVYACILVGVLALCRVPNETDDHHAQLERQYEAEREKL